jgi:hypothetical protein
VFSPELPRRPSIASPFRGFRIARDVRVGQGSTEAGRSEGTAAAPIAPHENPCSRCPDGFFGTHRFVWVGDQALRVRVIHTVRTLRGSARISPFKRIRNRMSRSWTKVPYPPAHQKHLDRSDAGPEDAGSHVGCGARSVDGDVARLLPKLFLGLRSL